MSIFHLQEFQQHEQVMFITDEPSGLRAIIAIHSSAPFGLAGGGCRMQSYGTEEEAVRDALRLSYAMSLKLALTDMPAGGAKAVVIGDPKKDKSERMLLALGRAVEGLNGRFVISEDVGMTPADMRIVGLQTRFVNGRQQNTAVSTAYGVFCGLQTAVRRHLDRDLQGVRVALQGLGNVGRRLGERLAEAGASLIVCDVDEETVATLRSAIDEVEVVAPEAIYQVDAEVFAPCGPGGVLDDDTVEALRCRVVAGSANNQLSHARHARRLAERGILYAPDFVINAGGVMGAAFEGIGTDGAIDEEAVMREAERVSELLLKVWDRAERNDVSPHHAAVALAGERLAEWRATRDAQLGGAS